MKVSFHGYKNVGFIGITAKERRNVFEGPNSTTICHVELTNKNGNDIDKFQNILKKYPNHLNPNVLEIKSIHQPFRKKSFHTMLINEHELDLEKAKGIPEMEQIQELMENIAQTPYKEIEYDPKYFRSFEAATTFLSAFKNSITEEPSGNKFFNLNIFDKIMNQAHQELTVKRGAKLIAKNIVEDILDYKS